ncbi:MAG: hypothetical protein IJT82_03440 [Schwartzia sp.]|nr:hypothetical protein [Schwartzia sp. (in: firmicutes)]
MKIIIEGEPKEIAALLGTERQSEESETEKAKESFEKKFIEMMESRKAAYS